MENFKKILKNFKNIVLLVLGIFFILIAYMMISYDIMATIFFGILAVICLYFGKGLIIDAINKQKEDKIEKDYRVRQTQLMNELNLKKIETANEITKKELELQKEKRLKEIELQKQENIKHFQQANQKQTLVNNELNTLENLADGYAFEEYIAKLLEKLNYTNIEVTQLSNDYGIDVLAEKDNIKYAIQCKFYSQPVGNKAVQEAFSGKSFYNSHIAVVATNNTFTENAKNLAKSNGVLLWDKEVLEKMINEAFSNLT